MEVESQEDFKRILEGAAKKLQNGVSFEELSKEEKEVVSMYEKQMKAQSDLPLSSESHENKERFNKSRANAEFEINHITDLHATPEEFEGRLINELISKEHLKRDKNGNIHGIKDNVAVAITGDIGSDFFDQSRHGLEAYLSETIFKKANFSKEEEKEFKKNYDYIMNLAGLTEDMIIEKHKSLLGENSPLEVFKAYLYGIVDPRFLTNEEKSEFRIKQKKIQDMLKQGMYYHARTEYSKIRDILKKHNLNPNQVIMVGGNHDVHSVLEDVLGAYIVKPGEVRNVSGIKFGNIVRSANGNFTGGPDFDEVFGYAGLRERLEKEKTKSKPFQNILLKLNEGRKMNISEKDLKKYVSVSIDRAAKGIGTGALGNYIEKNTKKLLERKLEESLNSVKLPKGAEVILDHSVIDDPQRAGLEEFYAHELMSKNDDYKGMLVLGGHEHSPTPHQKDGIFHINPGSITAGNSGVHLLDKNKNYSSSLFESLGSNNETVYRHMLKSEVPGQASGRNKG